MSSNELECPVCFQEMSPPLHIWQCAQVKNNQYLQLSLNFTTAGTSSLRALQAATRGEVLPHLQTEDRRQSNTCREDCCSGLLRQGEHLPPLHHHHPHPPIPPAMLISDIVAGGGLWFSRGDLWPGREFTGELSCLLSRAFLQTQAANLLPLPEERNEDW